MQILLLGRDTSTTNTVEQMLESANQWSVTRSSAWAIKDQKKHPQIPNEAAWDIIIANLTDFAEPSPLIIQGVTSYFSAVPLLVLYSYNKKELIEPLLEAGATGYFQNSSSETDLIETVKSVSAGKECISTESTYQQ